jgi:type II secretory pathway pseudopilin PulG
MKMLAPTRRPKPSEEGYVLVAVIFMVAILVLTLATAAPKIAKEIQRDREVETMHRGKQYRRAIQLYYRKFNRYPPNVDALVKTNEIRFLRKKYIDPTTGKEEWKPVLFGMNKAPMAMGFFGQALGGSTIAGTGPSGGNGLQGAQGSNSLFNNSSTNTPNGTNGTNGPNGAGSDPNNPGANGTNGTSAPDSNSGSSAFGQTGQSFGGAGIVGFEPNSPKESILVYKKKTHYIEWEFTYDPISEQMTMQGGNMGNNGLNGQPASSTTTPVGGSGFGNNSSFGNNSNSGSFGSNSNAGSNGSSPQPTQ